MSFTRVTIPEIRVVCPHCKEPIRLPEDDMRRTAGVIEHIVTTNALRRLSPVYSAGRFAGGAFVVNLLFNVWLMIYWGFGFNTYPPTAFDVVMGAFSTAALSATLAVRFWPR